MTRLFQLKQNKSDMFYQMVTTNNCKLTIILLIANMKMHLLMYA